MERVEGSISDGRVLDLIRGWLEQGQLLDMLAQRIDDQAFLNLIRKWLKAGILDTDGTILDPVTGTPQGGVITPWTQKITFGGQFCL